MRFLSVQEISRNMLVAFLFPVHITLTILLPTLVPQFRFVVFRFASQNIAFACGGSGSLFKSTDGGKTWKRDKSTDSVAGNLYAVKFFGSKGYILGEFLLAAGWQEFEGQGRCSI